MPMKARSTFVRYTVLVASVVLGACAGDSTAPVAPSVASASAVSPFVPSAATKSLVGVSNGSYTFTIDPRRSQALMLGANMLSLPAGTICDIATSSYGSGHWDESCAPQTEPVTITAVVRNAKSSHPSIDFYPAMRFSPEKNVTLYFYTPAAERKQSHDMVMKYCNDDKVCVDESQADASLRTMTDHGNGVVFRRIKHFSGYIIATSLVDELENVLF